MAWTKENALGDEDITVISRNDRKGVYVIQLGELEENIEIQINVKNKNNMYQIDQSHAIKTPLQRQKYHLNLKCYDDEAYALHMCIFGLTQYYRKAKQAGYEPMDEWLEPI